MAMDKSSMASRIIANIEARNSNLDAANKAALIPYIEDICDGVIEEIKAAMEIQTSVPVIGVQTGGSTVNATGQQTSIT
jgi:hypothetical protein